MHLVAGFFLFVLGFAMLTAGVALFVGGEVTFKSGKKIPKRLARKVGIAFISFFPAILVGNFLLRLLDRENAVPVAVVNWPIALTCLSLGLVWLQRGMEGRSRQAGTAIPTPAALSVEPAAAQPSAPAELEFDGPAAPAPAPVKPGRARNNPFDFT
jgi:hypothetical protein